MYRIDRTDDSRPAKRAFLISTLTLLSITLLQACSNLSAAEETRKMAEVRTPQYYPLTTRKWTQLTGDMDLTRRQPTMSLTHERAGLAATDLGSTFEHKGWLVFLFGDSHGQRESDWDTFGITNSAAPDVQLSIPTERDGIYRRMLIPTLDYQAAFAIPSGGLSINDKMYVVYTTDWNRSRGNMQRSVVARSTDDGQSWSELYTLSNVGANSSMANTHFINVSMAEVDAETYGGKLPYATGKVVLIWGTGAYRKSNAYLACIPSAEIENANALRYFSGLDAEAKPTWSSEERSAAPLFYHARLGEFSVAWIEALQQWVMMYNYDHPYGKILMRFAPEPWGEWSGAQLIFDPAVDGGYGHFIHQSPEVAGYVDGFSDAEDRENVSGDPYGPYVIARYTQELEGRVRLFYVLSTWNPYQVVLMSCDVGYTPPVQRPELTRMTIMPGDERWRKTSSDFYETSIINGTPHVITYTAAQGDQATGMMWQWLPRDRQNRKLQFTLHGGSGEVMLIEGGGDIPVSGLPISAIYQNIKKNLYGRVVLTTWGANSNETIIPIEWLIAPYDSEQLKVVIIDHQTGPWGFVTVSRMELERYAYPAAPQSKIEATTWTAYR